MYPGVYGAVPPDVEGRDVIIVDFSYSLAVTAEIMRRCKSMTFIDHHKTAFEVAGYLGSAHPQATVSFDVSMCGAMLTWRHYFPDRAVPPWLHYINDRDLYLHKLPGCREFSLALRSWPQDFLTWSSILQDVPGLVKDGRPITRYYDRQCAQMAANNFRMVIGGCNVKVANCPLIFASEVAGILAKDEPFGAAFCVQMNRKVEFSLRSVPGAKDSRDVAEIAKQYHGGGHPNASGFTAPAGMVPWGDYVAKPSPATSVTP
jgi:oligoribonuclease NrnB/cAMP/cGMP phosphodiesterase (DHH superfamily)